MAARRYAAPPPLSYSPRSSLNPTINPEIDVVLKLLKTCTRQLQTALASHRLELQILERLYYKGKNQHRTALFWQRVSELRRYGDRLEGVRMFDLVERLRLSFWGDPTLLSSKVLKGPWICCPDVRSVQFVLRRSFDCCKLIDKTQERLSAAYHALTLQMQTAAFLQLILTLVAITSRLSSLLIAIRSAVEASHKACHRLLQILDPQQAQKAARFLSTVSNDVKDIPLESKPIPRQNPSAANSLGEDLGSILQRPRTPKAEEGEDTLIQISQNELTSCLNLEPTSSDASVAVASSLSVTTVQTAVVRKPAKPTAAEQVAPTAKRKILDSQERSTPIKKKKKKSNEIDDIFGF